MNKEDKEEIREIVSSCSATLKTTVEGQYKVIDTKLNTINDHLERINGSVGKHEKKINDALLERAANREIQKEDIKDMDVLKPKVRSLEDQQLTTRSIKKWIVTSVALTGSVLGLFYILYQLIQHAGI